MTKRIIIFAITLVFTIVFLSAQSKDIDYYSIGYNDAVSRHKFDSKYSIENLSKSLKNISTEAEKKQFVENAESYNLGYASGICKEQGIALLVDAISAFIADEVLMDEWNLSAVITGSQKALAVHPGVSVVVLSPDAVKRVEENSELCMYLSLKSALKNAERGQTPFTPAVTTLLQIHTRLREIEENGGIEKERAIIKKRAAVFRESISDLPLSIISESCSNAVTALHPLKNNAKEIVQHLKEDYQIWVCPNGGEKADEVFRVGHFGCISEKDNRTLIDALHDLNHRKIL